MYIKGNILPYNFRKIWHIHHQADKFQNRREKDMNLFFYHIL